MNADGGVAGTDVRASVRQRLQQKRDPATNLVAYVVANAFLIIVRAVNGADYFFSSRARELGERSRWSEHPSLPVARCPI